jgi:NitT/TauT family transport system substrate-binding protein
VSARTIRVADRWEIFNLPWHVANERGYFADESIAVEFSMSEAAPPSAGTRAFSPEVFGDGRTKERAFHLDAKIDAYNTCEWGAIQRTTAGGRVGRIIGERCSVVGMAIVASPHSKIYALRDLADVPIATSFYNGDHYLILELVGGAVGRAHAKPLHTSGGYHERVRQLLSGEHQAGTFMEPYLSLAEKNGCRVITETYFRGAEVGSPELDPDTIARVFRALGRAARDLQRDVTPYVPRFVAEANRDTRGLTPITPSDFRASRLRYVEPEPYTATEFQRTYDWMVEWDLVAPGHRYEDLVRSDIAPVYDTTKAG